MGGKIQSHHAPPSCLFGSVMIFSDNAPSLRLPSSSLQPHFGTSHPLPSPPTSHRPNQTSVSVPTSPFARSRLCAFPNLCFALSNVPMFPNLLFQRSNSFTSSLSSQVGGVGSSKSGNLISWGRRVGAAGHPTVQNDDFSLLAGQTESVAMVLITNKKTFMGTCGGQKIYKSHKLCHRSR